MLARYIQPEPEVQLVIDQLSLKPCRRGRRPKFTAHGSHHTDFRHQYARTRAEADDGGKTKTADAWPPGRDSTSVATSQARCSAPCARLGTCRRAIVLARYIQPEPEVQLVIDQLSLTLPARPPPKIHRPRL